MLDWHFIGCRNVRCDLKCSCKFGEDGHHHLAVAAPGGVEGDEGVAVPGGDLPPPGVRHHHPHPVLLLLAGARGDRGPQEGLQLCRHEARDPGLELELARILREDFTIMKSRCEIRTPTERSKGTGGLVTM